MEGKVVNKQECNLFLKLRRFLLLSKGGGEQIDPNHIGVIYSFVASGEGGQFNPFLCSAPRVKNIFLGICHD